MERYLTGKREEAKKVKLYIDSDQTSVDFRRDDVTSGFVIRRRRSSISRLLITHSLYFLCSPLILQHATLEKL